MLLHSLNDSHQPNATVVKVRHLWMCISEVMLNQQDIQGTCA